VTVHGAMPLETATSVQLVVGENAPAPFEEKPTVPVGVLTGRLFAYWGSGYY
jgi:hypothetical protein